MRECRRVLRSGGRIAVVVIETGGRLRPEELALAAELGPAEVRADADLPDLMRSTGLVVREVEDLTEDFARDVASLVEGLLAGEDELRAAEGDREYDYELSRRTSMLEAIRRGLIRRTLAVGRRP